MTNAPNTLNLAETLNLLTRLVNEKDAALKLLEMVNEKNAELTYELSESLREVDRLTRKVEALQRLLKGDNRNKR